MHYNLHNTLRSDCNVAYIGKHIRHLLLDDHAVPN
jgi:hypothetical protein